MPYQFRVAKYTRRALPGQLRLIPADLEPVSPDHDPTGLTSAMIAAWILARSAGQTTKRERTFLFGIARGTNHPTSRELARLSALHRRIGGRPLAGDGASTSTAQTGDADRD